MEHLRRYRSNITTFLTWKSQPHVPESQLRFLTQATLGLIRKSILSLPRGLPHYLSRTLKSLEAYLKKLETQVQTSTTECSPEQIRTAVSRFLFLDPEPEIPSPLELGH